MNKLMIAAVALALPGMASAQMLSGKQYVTKAGASDQYEIQSSRLILNSTRNPNLRSYAQDMIRDHQASTADVKRAAMRAHVMAGPPHLDAMGARNIAQLNRARGPARDALYIQQQKKSHQMALDLQQGYARDGREQPLKMAATKIVPVVQHHLGMLQRM